MSTEWYIIPLDVTDLEEAHGELNYQIILELGALVQKLFQILKKLYWSAYVSVLALLPSLASCWCVPWKAVVMAQVVESSLHSCERSKLRSRFLALTWLNPGWVGHLESECMFLLFCFLFSLLLNIKQNNKRLFQHKFWNSCTVFP